MVTKSRLSRSSREATPAGSPKVGGSKDLERGAACRALLGLSRSPWHCLRSQARCVDRGNGSADNIRASGSYSSQKKAEDMTAPTTRATPKIALDQRAASRHDSV